MSSISAGTENFPAESVNKTDFQFRQAERQRPIVPKSQLEPPTGPFFVGESSSREAFRAWKPQAMQRHQHPAYERPEGSIDLSTTYSTQFINTKAYVRLPPIRPESQHRQQRQDQRRDFSSSTEQAESYPSYRRIQLAKAKQPSCKPARPYLPPDVPFDALSSYAGDFSTAASHGPIEKAQPVRHEDQLQLSTEAMESRSGSSSSSYGAGALVGAVSRRQPIVPRGELAVSSGEPFMSETTQRGDFALQPHQPRREPIKPAGQICLSSTSEPFASVTASQEAFVARAVEGRQAPVKPRGELELSAEPMASVTTTRDVYTPKVRDDPPPTRRRQHIVQ